MRVNLPEAARTLLDAANLVTVSTINPDGSPQASVLWATYDGDDLLLSTIRGRIKDRNWKHDPRTSVVILDKDNPYAYVEVRGGVTLTEDGGPELIDRLSHIYTGEHYTGDDGTANVRVVARLSPERVFVRP